MLTDAASRHRYKDYQLAKIKKALEKTGTPWSMENMAQAAHKLSCSDLGNDFKTVDVIDWLAIEKELDPAFPLKLPDEMINYHEERNKNRISIKEKLADYDRMKEELMVEKNKKATRIGCGFDEIIRYLAKTHPNTLKKVGKKQFMDNMQSATGKCPSESTVARFFKKYFY